MGESYGLRPVPQGSSLSMSGRGGMTLWVLTAGAVVGGGATGGAWTTGGCAGVGPFTTTGGAGGGLVLRDDGVVPLSLVSAEAPFVSVTNIVMSPSKRTISEWGSRPGASTRMM